MKNGNRKYIIVAVLILLLALLGCGGKIASVPTQEIHHKQDSQSLPAGIAFPVDGLPPIESFSSNQYENYAAHIPAVSQVIYHDNGATVEMSPADPRIIRLLNFVAYSEEENLSAWLQGYVDSDRISEILASNLPMLEIHFNVEAISDQEKQFHYDKMIVHKQGCFFFLDTESISWASDDEVIAELCFPYEELLNIMVEKGSLEEKIALQYFYDGWLDILNYAEITLDSVSS